MERTINNELEKKSIGLTNDMNKEIIQSQDNFLETTLGKSLNNAVDFGIRTITPDLIEQQIIDVKNAIVEKGLNGGIEALVSEAKEFASSVMGLFKGKFNNVEEMNLAVKKGGILDTASDAISIGVDALYKNNKIDKTTAQLIENGKDSIINQFSKNIENRMENEKAGFDALESNIEKWEEALDSRNIDEMKSSLKDINKNLKELVKFEDVLERAESLKEHHAWIVKNNDFDYKPANEFTK